MSKIGPRFKYLEQPIFFLCVIKDYVLVASGGGGKKFGVRNRIASFSVNNNKFSDEVCHSVEFDKEIPVFLSTFEPANIFCTCIDNITVFYSINLSNGTFTELYRLKVCNYFDADIYQSVCRIDESGQNFAGCTTDGHLKIWHIDVNNWSNDPVLKRECQAHLKSINDCLFINNKNYVVTGASDGLIKIFELSTLKLLKKLSFKTNETEKNYLIRGLAYDKHNNYLYSIQAPLKGYSYLTKWDVKNNFQPISSIEVSDSICTSMDYSYQYGVIGLSDCKGSLIFVDASYMVKIKEIERSEITVKSVAFKDSNIISGAADNSISMNYIYKPGIISFTSFFKIFIIVFFVYYLYSKIKQIN